MIRYYMKTDTGVPHAYCLRRELGTTYLVKSCYLFPFLFLTLIRIVPGKSMPCLYLTRHISSLSFSEMTLIVDFEDTIDHGGQFIRKASRLYLVAGSVRKCGVA